MPAKDTSAACIVKLLRKSLLQSRYGVWLIGLAAEVETEATKVHVKSLEQIDLGALGLLLNDVGGKVGISQESGFRTNF